MESLTMAAAMLLVATSWMAAASAAPRAVPLAGLLEDDPRSEAIAYKQTDAAPLLLHRFAPPAPIAGGATAVVWVHGGGWTAGNASLFFPHARYFAARGAAAFSVQYRRASPDGTGLPEAIADVRSAIRHLRANADTLGIHPDRIVVLGDSAGGHLAAAACLIDAFDDPADDRSVSATPNAAILYNPITDLTDPAWIKFAVGGPALARGAPAVEPTPGRLDAARRLSPRFAVRADAPPMLVLHGNDDSVVLPSQSQAFVEAMQQAGNDCTFVRVESARHAFVVPRYTAPEAVVVRAIRAADDFLVARGWLDGGATLVTSESLASPLNQVFQFMQPGECPDWPDGSTTKAVAYLWIPENARRIRGVLILCTNVPEHRLVGHPTLRAACERNDLAILCAVPSFMNFRKDQPRAHAVIAAFLQQLLDGLAAQSGYDELATAPWLPIGESGHLLMVDALVEARPDRCIAGVWLKNHHLPPANRTVPALVVFGTAQEWSQDKSDIREKWRDVAEPYAAIRDERDRHPGWPLSYVLDPTSGHFDASDRIVSYLARYIDEVTKARLPAEVGQPLKAVSIEAGFVAGLSTPTSAATAIEPWREAGADERTRPWYFTRDSAREAQAIAAVDWAAATQLPTFLDADGQPLPFDFNGIANLGSVRWEPDGKTFRLEARLLERIPASFAVGAGDPLPRAPGPPAIEWLCGPVAPAGEGRFRIALDRTYGAAACYLAARHPGGDGIRGVVQPLGVNLNALKHAGQPQRITFEPIADVPAGTESVPLHATSDAGLPVEFFVVAGPAIVRDGRLHLTHLPPRVSGPVTVTVAAWQWGRDTEPAIRTAGVVRQSFRVLPATSPATRPAALSTSMPSSR